MKVLVTGASGFIGGNLVSAFTRKGWEVLPLKREGRNGDLRNRQSILELVRGVDVVVNTAAALSYHNLPEKDYWDINVGGTKNVIDACIRNKIKKIVHISTVAALDDNATDIYARSKRAGDRLIWENRDKLQGVIVRPTIAYGPGDVRPVFLRLFRLIKKGIGITVGGGRNFLHTVYIDNLVSGIALATAKRVQSGEDFIIGDEKCPRMREIVEMIAKVQNKKYINIDIPKVVALWLGKIVGMEKTVRFNSEDRKYTIEKAKEVLGYNPKVGLNQGMKFTYDWYRKNNLL